MAAIRVWLGLPQVEGIKAPPTTFVGTPAGVHVLFGPNNSGKTRVLNALAKSVVLTEIPWSEFLDAELKSYNPRANWSELIAPVDPILVQRNRGLEPKAASKEALDFHSTTAAALMQQFSGKLDRGTEGLFLSIRDKVKHLAKTVPPGLVVQADRFITDVGHIAGGDPPDGTSPEALPVYLRNLKEDFATEELYAAVQHAFLQVSGLRFQMHSRNAEVRVYIYDAHGRRPLSECGDGLRDLLYLLTRALGDPHRDLFVDDPGVRLHPFAQRQLLEFLLEQSQRRAIWLASHDGVFVGAQQVSSRYAVTIRDGATVVERVDAWADAQERFWMMGWLPQDAFLADTLLLCEGECDRIVFDAVLRSQEGRRYLGVVVAAVEGIWESGNKQARALATAVSKIATHARRIALFDDDGVPAAVTSLKTFLEGLNVRLNLLTRGQLEDYWLMDLDFLRRLMADSAETAARKTGREIPTPDCNGPRREASVAVGWGPRSSAIFFFDAP